MSDIDSIPSSFEELTESQESETYCSQLFSESSPETEVFSLLYMLNMLNIAN